MLNLQIEFHGICLVAVDKDKLEPDESDFVTVLLPDAKPKHRDKTIAVPHRPHLLIPKANVPDHGSFDCVISTGKQIEYVVVPLKEMDVSFDPAPTRPTQPPNGNNTTVGLKKLIDFKWFTDDLGLHPDVKPMHTDPVVQPGSAATGRVATRVRLQSGYFYTEDASPTKYAWSFETSLARTAKFPPTNNIALKVFHMAVVPDRFDVVLRPFDGSGEIRLTVTGTSGGEVLIKIGNECLDPEHWDNEHMRCNGSPVPGPIVRDTDFKAHYELLESRPPIEARLGTEELPVPTITTLSKFAIATSQAASASAEAGSASTRTATESSQIHAVGDDAATELPPTAGSEWCERALIQVD